MKELTGMGFCYLFFVFGSWDKFYELGNNE